MQACLKVLPFQARTLCGLRLIVSCLAPLAAPRPGELPFKARWARLCTWMYVGVNEREWGGRGKGGREEIGARLRA
jgi:hypothetical protein